MRSLIDKKFWRHTRGKAKNWQIGGGGHAAECQVGTQWDVAL